MAKKFRWCGHSSREWRRSTRLSQRGSLSILHLPSRGDISQFQIRILNKNGDDMEATPMSYHSSGSVAHRWGLRWWEWPLRLMYKVKSDCNVLDVAWLRLPSSVLRNTSRVLYGDGWQEQVIMKFQLLLFSMRIIFSQILRLCIKFIRRFERLSVSCAETQQANHITHHKRSLSENKVVEGICSLHTNNRTVQVCWIVITNLC